MAKMTRYSNNIGEFGLEDVHAQEKLKFAKVLVMGAGALGSCVIMNLCALGVGQIKIIDNGIVELEDLNSEIIHKPKYIGRAKVISAKDWIQEFNPDIRVELDKIKLNELNYFNIISNYDIIVNCFNDQEAKYMLNEIALRHNKILVHGETRGFYGQLTTIIPPESGCLNCVCPKPKNIKEEHFAKISTVDSIFSSLMAQEVLKIITQTGTPLVNKLLIYDGIKGEFNTVDYVKIITCDVCQEKKYEQFS